MLLRICCCVFLLLGSVASHADELTAQKKADIRKLIVVTGGTKIAAQFADAVSQNLSQTLRSVRPDIPDRFFQVLHKELMALFSEKMDAPGGMIDQVIPVYAKHFTHADIRDLLAFYQTRIGRKSIEVLPLIVSESMAIGQKWGQGLEPEIRRRVETALQKEGIELPR